MEYHGPWKKLRLTSKERNPFLTSLKRCDPSSNTASAATYTPMERVNIDTVGPLPADKHGNKYITVIIECFSRWIRLVPCTDATTETAARNVLMPWLCDFGCPEVILSDNGTQFVNNLWKSLSELVGTNLRNTTPHSKEENSIVERAIPFIGRL